MTFATPDAICGSLLSTALCTFRRRCIGGPAGVSTHKKDRKYPYYLCSKRWNIKDCDQDYVPADLLESAILQDIKGMFRDEQCVARIWEEANRRLCAEKPSVDREIGNVEAQIAKARATIDRYFEAFEAETMKPEVCMQKVDDLNARIEQLETEKRDLEERRQRLELPPSTGRCSQAFWTTSRT